MATNFAFLHGGGQGSWVWDQTIAALHLQAGDEAVRAIALDAPGCGAKRDRATDGLTMQDVAAELVADIERAGLTDVILVGHSQAGQAMPFMTKLRPALFRRLVYVSCSMPLPGQSVSQMMGKNLRGINPQEVGWPVDPASGDHHEKAMRMFYNDMSEEQAAPFLARIGKDMWPLATYSQSDWPYEELGKVPATFVLCLRDEALPPDWQHTFAERLKVERLVQVDAGHQVMNSRPHALAEIVRLEA
ncbi:MAG TPA: alpha/beta hydrolase [Sphingobium sp.]|uniref:alpha/beta fold hydrolase n=1 Tax=Sphingobium sp. TaxID=1912891 RepID=UPI002ED1837F